MDARSEILLTVSHATLTASVIGLLVAIVVRNILHKRNRALWLFDLLGDLSLLLGLVIILSALLSAALFVDRLL